jgi:hypothetical protein
MVRVERPLDAAGILRRVVIEMDGLPLMRVGHGKSAEARIEPGRHAVRARMDWHSSRTLEVDIADGETATVQVSYRFSSIRTVLQRSECAIHIQHA